MSTEQHVFAMGEWGVVPILRRLADVLEAQPELACGELNPIVREVLRASKGRWHPAVARDLVRHVWTAIAPSVDGVEPEEYGS